MDDGIVALDTLITGVGRAIALAEKLPNWYAT